MSYLLNSLYAVALLLLFPWLLVRHLVEGRSRRDLRAKLFGPSLPPRDPARRRVWFHGVSVGEVHLLCGVVAAFRRRHPDWDCVISSTTDTGLAEARKRFGDLTVIAWPFDFSWAVSRALARVAPDLVVLAESELWPNFLRAARQRQVPVMVINARMSPRSLRRYRAFGRLARALLFDPVAHWAVQSEEYARHFGELGVPPERVGVTGSVKYDGASGDPGAPKVAELRRLFALGPLDRVWVAGSTHAPEEKAVLDAFRRLRVRYPNLRLVLVPRKPERFDEVAALIGRMHFSCARRSRMAEPFLERPAVILVDTIGELNAVWGLADVAFVGGSLDGKRGGQSMIEPAGYGVPVVFGPHVWNFRDAAARLLEAGGAVRLNSAAELEGAVRGLLDDPIGRERVGANARRLVQQQQGATERTLNLIDQVLGQVEARLRKAG